MPCWLLFISPYVSSLSFFLLWLLWIVLQTLPSAVTSALQSRWVPMVAKQNVRPTGRQTQPLTPTDRHTHVHTHSLSHTLTHTHAHTHTLSLTLPPPHVTPSLRLFLCPILYLSDPQHCHLVCDQRQGAVVPARRPAPPHVHHLQGHEPRACVWAHGLFFPAGLPGPLRRL